MSDINGTIVKRFTPQIAKAHAMALQKIGTKRDRLDEAVRQVLTAGAQVPPEKTARLADISALYEKFKHNREACESETGMTFNELSIACGTLSGEIMQATQAALQPFNEYGDMLVDMAFTAADNGFAAGTVAGFRIGFKLAGLLSMGSDPVNRSSEEALPGISKDDFHMHVALSMTDDMYAAELVAAMLEDEAETTGIDE